MDDDEFLAHYGVLGMHWGKHQNGSSGSPNKRRAKKEKYDKEQSDDSKFVKELRKKKVHEFSNDELKALNNRMQLERQFKDLKKKDISSGEQLAKDILKDLGKDVLKSTIRSTITGDLNANPYAKRFSK